MPVAWTAAILQGSFLPILSSLPKTEGWFICRAGEDGAALHPCSATLSTHFLPYMLFVAGWPFFPSEKSACSLRANVQSPPNFPQLRSLWAYCQAGLSALLDLLVCTALCHGDLTWIEICFWFTSPFPLEDEKEKNYNILSIFGLKFMWVFFNECY